MKTMIIELKVEENDFCVVDLKEVLEEGFSNVGNHTLLSRNVIKEVEE